MEEIQEQCVLLIESIDRATTITHADSESPQINLDDGRVARKPPWQSKKDEMRNRSPSCASRSKPAVARPAGSSPLGTQIAHAVGASVESTHAHAVELGKGTDLR